MRAAAGLILILASFLGACAPTMHTVTIQVLRTPDTADAPADTVTGAHIRAIPLGLSPMPLPVSLETIREAKTAPGPGGVTGEDGRVALRLNRDRQYLLEVDPPIMSDESLRGLTWQWTLLADGVTLREDRAVGNPPGMILIVERD